MPGNYNIKNLIVQLKITKNNFKAWNLFNNAILWHTKLKKKSPKYFLKLILNQ